MARAPHAYAWQDLEGEAELATIANSLGSSFRYWVRVWDGPPNVPIPCRSEPLLLEKTSDPQSTLWRSLLKQNGQGHDSGYEVGKASLLVSIAPSPSEL